ncbi:hypothetical protein ACIPW5_16925 [Streptomyces sp. NPDC090077]|uniref:hypothetical protein n=1 Tax=Streptomyces sp. NPDC090077 TaxID=3365938 RepID=UPI00382E973B
MLVLIRDHTEPYPEEGEYEDADGEEEYVHPPFKVLAERGPVYRVCGDCSADLTRTPRFWALTARQETHPECLPDVEAFLAALTPHLATSADRPIGSLHFC